MTIDELKEIAAKHGIKVGWTRKGLYRQLAESIVDGEEVLLIVEGLAGTNKVPVIVTPDRVYMAWYQTSMGGMDVQTINRSKIEGVATSGTLLKRVIISTAGKDYVVEKIAPDKAQELKKIIG